MSFYDNWGMPDKPRHECPICGVETKKGNSCNYHAQGRRRHEREALKYRVEKMTQMICECVEEARA